MISRELRHLHEVLNHKADALQREFGAANEESRALGHKIDETRGEERERLIAVRTALHERQAAIAEEVNVWRDRARAVLRQPDEASLRAYLVELAACDDETVRAAADHTVHLLDLTPEEVEQMAQSRERAQARVVTPAGRMLERARTEYDLRGDDPAPRRRAAFEFANRPGMAQNDEALAEIEAGLAADDAVVKEMASLIFIEMHRFRAMRLSDLDSAYASVERLSRLKHHGVIRVMIEVLEAPRSGFVQSAGGVREAHNTRLREAALRCLAEWHNSETQAALRGRRLDREPEIAAEANRLLDAAPGEWS